MSDHEETPPELLRQFMVRIGLLALAVLLVASTAASTAGFFLGRGDEEFNDKAERRSLCAQRVTNARNELILAESVQAELLTDGLILATTGGSDEALAAKAVEVDAQQEIVREAREALQVEGERYRTDLVDINAGEPVDCSE